MCFVLYKVWKYSWTLVVLPSLTLRRDIGNILFTYYIILGILILQNFFFNSCGCVSTCSCCCIVYGFSVFPPGWDWGFGNKTNVIVFFFCPVPRCCCLRVIVSNVCPLTMYVYTVHKRKGPLTRRRAYMFGVGVGVGGGDPTNGRRP